MAAEISVETRIFNLRKIAFIFNHIFSIGLKSELLSVGISTFFQIFNKLITVVPRYRLCMPCRLLSNMLENAVTACVNSNSPRRQIYLKITSDGSNISFSLKNTIDSSVLANNKHLHTTKDINGEHGYGTKIIRDIAIKYNGRCDFYEEDNFFCCNVILRK